MAFARHADQFVIKLNEGTRYLLITNGAALVAIISGIGEAWHHPELQGVFKTLISGFSCGFFLCILLWYFAALASAAFSAFKAEVDGERFTSGTWIAWQNFTIAQRIWSVFAIVDAYVIVRTAWKAASILGAGWRDLW